MKFIKIPSTAPCVMVSFLVALVLTAAFPHISFTRDHSNATRSAQQSYDEVNGTTELLAVTSAAQAASSGGMDETAIRKTWQDYLAAWNKHDANALAAFMTEDADRRIPDGRISNGRAAVLDAIGNEFRSVYRNATLSSDQVDVRFLTPDVAILDARDELRGVNGAGESVQRTNHTSIFLKRDGKWLTVAIRAWALPSPVISPPQ